MTNEEFSNEFDTLISSVYNTSIKLDEYEKSVYLTLALENLVKGLYNGSALGEPVELTEELRKYLDTLIKTDSPLEVSNILDKKINSKSILYKLKDDVWFIIYESVTFKNATDCLNDDTIQVVPMKHDEWHRVKNNPFRKPNKRRVIRLDFGDSTSELVSEYSIKEYKVRYISKPDPIILIDLEDDLSINNKKTKTECKLHSALHRLILELAVKLALSNINANK